MRRILTMLASVAIVMAAVSCEKEQTPELGFGKSHYVLLPDAPLTVDVVTNVAPAADLTVELSFTGDAVLGEDYLVSSESVVIPAGQVKGSLTITPEANYEADRSIVLSMTLPAGYASAKYATATVAVEAKELLMYSFEVAEADVLDSYVVKLNISGATSGTDWVATEDMQIPFKFVEALENPDVVTFDTENYFALAKGENVAKVTVSATGLETGETAEVKLAVDEEKAGERFVAGENTSITLNVKGILTIKSLLGTWTFNEVLALEEIEFFYMEMEDDVELLPTHNEGFSLTFSEVVAEDGSVSYKVTPSGEGDWNNYFRESAIDYTAPINMTSTGEATGDYTSSELNMFVAEAEDIDAEQLTYFGLETANRSFDNTAESIGKGAIAMRLNAEGKLIIHLKDYDQPPFGLMWWDGFDADMFAFVSSFTKAE